MPTLTLAGLVPTPTSSLINRLVEKRAWYRLLAHALPIPQNLGNSDKRRIMLSDVKKKIDVKSSSVVFPFSSSRKETEQFRFASAVQHAKACIGS